MTCLCGHDINPTSARSQAPCEFCRESTIVIVGEAWGENEERFALPFQGSAGVELRDQLKSVGIERAFLTNALNFRPPRNDLKRVCVPKKHLTAHTSPISQGYLPRDVVARELGRLKDEIEQVNPRIVVALGNTAQWALTGELKVSKKRGTVMQGNLTKHEVLSTYHPAAVLRQYKWRMIAQADLAKALKLSQQKTFSPRKRTFCVSPTLLEIETYISQHLLSAELISFDIETIGNLYITCIGFAPSPETALVIPFVHEGRNYWESFEDELLAWKLVRKILALPNPKLAQNGMYDIQYLYRHGIPVKNYLHDTMILHHCLQPELEKSLGFLSSVYIEDAVSWKEMRTADKTGKN